MGEKFVFLRNKTCFDNFNFSHLQKLEEEHKVLKQTAESSNKISEEAVLSVANSKATLEKVQAENGSMKKQILNLECKL